MFRSVSLAPINDQLSYLRLKLYILSSYIAWPVGLGTSEIQRYNQISLSILSNIEFSYLLK